MASSLFALLDDITTILDDVAVLSKVAAKKTSGVLGDDLALNAQQVAGVNPDREIPVVWAVFKGSLINKVILVPAALAISAVLPAAIPYLLMIGGAYLCFEGVEKLAHKFLHSKETIAAEAKTLETALLDPSVDMVQLEKDKIKGAVRTDFILSAEIIVIALGTMASVSFLTQSITLAAIALIMTVGVYGLVAGIVKLDDLGLYLSRKTSRAQQVIGAGLLAFAPWLMKALSVAGLIAMFLVGGGIFTHGLPWLHHLIEGLQAGQNGLVAGLIGLLGDLLVGIVIGAIVLAVWLLIQRAHSVRPH